MELILANWRMAAVAALFFCGVALRRADWAGAAFDRHPQFGLEIPGACPEVPPEVLDPRRTWQDGATYDAKAQEVAQRFERNFARFEPHVEDQVNAAGIHAAA